MIVGSRGSGFFNVGNGDNIPTASCRASIHRAFRRPALHERMYKEMKEQKKQGRKETEANGIKHRTNVSLSHIEIGISV